jgi:pyruvate-formate lyase
MFGKLTGALPTGRNARKALTDGSVSAMPGTDVEGPTAFINSAAKVVDTVRWGANHCNMKFHPTALQGPIGARMLLSLIKSYCDMGGSHIQFNVVTRETLEAAQETPAKYKDLVVRVAGFSAYFIRLDKGVQDEIIKRTEYKA